MHYPYRPLERERASEKTHALIRIWGVQLLSRHPARAREREGERPEWSRRIAISSEQ